MKLSDRKKELQYLKKRVSVGQNYVALPVLFNKSSHMGSPSPFATILHVLHREPQVLHVVLDDFSPSLSLSSSTPLSMNVCLEDSFDTVIFFSPLYMPIPSQSRTLSVMHATPMMRRMSSFLFLSLIQCFDLAQKTVRHCEADTNVQFSVDFEI